MEDEPKNSVFEFNKSQVKEVQKLCNYYDINTLNQDIDLLQDWIRQQNHFVVKEFERDYLEKFLIANKGSVEKTKRRFDRLCTLRNLLPEITKNYDIRNEFVHLFKCTRQCVLPKPTKDHYRVIISEVHNGDDVENVELVHFYRLSIVFIEYMLQHDYNAGIEFIMDNRKISFGLVAKMNPLVVHKFFTLMEAYGLRLKTLHILSNSKFLDAVVAIMKQGMSNKLGTRIQVHSSMDSLYEFVPKDILPKEYGGEAASFEELSEKFLRELYTDEHIERMKFIEGVTTDETRRLSSYFNEEYSGMPGSFKTLSVD